MGRARPRRADAVIRPRSLGVLALLLSVATPGFARAQEPTDTTRTRPTPVPTARDTAGATVDTTAAAKSSRREVSRFVFGVSAGVDWFTDLQDQAASVTPLVGADAGTPTEIVRTLGIDGAVTTTASALVNLDRTWGVRVGAGLTRGSLSADYAGNDAAVAIAKQLPAVGDRGVRTLSVEGLVRYRISSGGRLYPYLELGLAAVRWSTDGTPGTVFPGASDLVNGTTQAAVVGGVGVNVAVTGRLEARLQATTRVSRTPLGTSPAGGFLAAADSASLAYSAPRGIRFADAAVETVRALRLDVGLTYGLGRVAPPPPPPPAPAGSSSPHRP